MPGLIHLGSWSFSPETGVLRQDDDVHRLEHRASSLLELLCREHGKVISHGDIIDQVWDGRSVSPNSVAVVISDIRRALADDARRPTYIETLPKRGYRFIAPVGLSDRLEPAPETGILAPPVKDNPQSLPRLIKLGFAFTLAIMAIGFVLMIGAQDWRGGGQVTLVRVTGVEDQTGNIDYSALAPAVSELLTVELMRHDDLRITSEPGASVIVSGKLILWDGHAAVSLHAQSAADGLTFWSGMASGPETMLPRQVRDEVAELAALVGEKNVSIAPTPNASSTDAATR